MMTMTLRKTSVALVSGSASLQSTEDASTHTRQPSTLLGIFVSYRLKRRTYASHNNYESLCSGITLVWRRTPTPPHGYRSVLYSSRVTRAGITADRIDVQCSSWIL